MLCKEHSPSVFIFYLPNTIGDNAGTSNSKRVLLPVKCVRNLMYTTLTQSEVVLTAVR